MTTFFAATRSTNCHFIHRRLTRVDGNCRIRTPRVYRLLSACFHYRRLSSRSYVILANSILLTALISILDTIRNDSVLASISMVIAA